MRHTGAGTFSLLTPSIRWDWGFIWGPERAIPLPVPLSLQGWPGFRYWIGTDQRQY